jgi:FKBP-type peptidyl-prolyl cis-trans isomerase FklB
VEEREDMKYVVGILLIITFTAWSCGGNSGEGQTVAMNTMKDSVSYSIGMDIGGTLKRQSIDINQDIFIQGFKDAYGEDTTQLSSDEMKNVIMAFQQQQRLQREEQVKQIAKKNKQEGEAYLEAHAREPGVVALPSGLQYKVLQAGTGPTPTINDRVRVHYKGMLLDGTVFDSSYERGQPATFGVGRVIRGWTEALQLMNVGSKWELTVPPDLAYGERGAGEKIEPNSVLIFEVELLGIENPEDLPQGTGK